MTMLRSFANNPIVLINVQNMMSTQWCELHGPRLNDQRFLLIDFMRWAALEARKHSWHEICIISKKLILYTISKKNAQKVTSMKVQIIKNPGPWSSHLQNLDRFIFSTKNYLNSIIQKNIASRDFVKFYNMWSFK